MHSCLIMTRKKSKQPVVYFKCLVITLRPFMEIQFSPPPNQSSVFYLRQDIYLQRVFFPVTTEVLIVVNISTSLHFYLLSVNVTVSQL